MSELSVFDRRFFGGESAVTRIGTGSLGGKAQGLVAIEQTIRQQFPPERTKGFTITIPRMTVIGTDFFDAFLAQNGLLEIAYSDAPDDRIGHAFQRGDLPPRLVGDLRAVTGEVRTPLAVRSSSMLEDALYQPFAGVYATKMIPNNQPDPDLRFRRLVEAVKFVWASTFFKEAKTYLKSVGKDPSVEKMAVIIQEVVGAPATDRFYPTFAGVARSYNFYPCGYAKPEDGVVDLALGLGKTIVDGGRVWSYSPAYPKAPPPYGNVGDMLKNTQTTFWAVHMGSPPPHDPIRETEYMIELGLDAADYDNTLRFVASTYDPGADRLVPGVGSDGPRVVNFGPILDYEEVPFNDLIRAVLKACEDAVKAPVEVEFAVTLDRKRGLPARFGFLQVRPMVVSSEEIDLPRERLAGDEVVVGSETVLGNGRRDDIQDIVYVIPESFEPRFTAMIAAELERMNAELADQGRPYLLVGFGRWGSSDPWLGIPVTWSTISGSRVIVEATLPQMQPDMSQGSHFFHNLTSFKVSYFSVRHTGAHTIDWDWIGAQTEVSRARFVRHVRTETPLSIQVDGRTGRGVILRHG
ncbi:MAG: PEP/pyruvate-binding domain-containing protein [Candidatus Eisenbacteria bacterium]|nr:PEP/pyruvate-binding domain-containing protein [Candidatus Eisenbacteria bacterium]